MIPLENPYHGKHVVVLGIGRSGMAAARLLLRSGATVTICDSGESKTVLERAGLLRKESAVVLTGTAAESDSTHYELAILSPGIEETTPLVVNVITKGIPIIGELELAFALCECPVVAITGTNGKTTTTELTSRMLSGAGVNNAACGNIGTPMSELVGADKKWDVLVVEVSSFQLETIGTFHPKVALWLNLSPNHLDRYPSIIFFFFNKHKKKCTCNRSKRGFLKIRLRRTGSLCRMKRNYPNSRLKRSPSARTLRMPISHCAALKSCTRESCF